jgi:hypothetical protein
MIRDTLFPDMKRTKTKRGTSIVLENTKVSCGHIDVAVKGNFCHINNLETFAYNLYTSYTQKMWKTLRRPCLLKVFLLFLCLCLSGACSSSKVAKDQAPKKSERIVNDESLVSLSENEVRKRLGEPTAVSKMADGRILWTYTPSWKFVPDNGGTVYVEFESGNAVKVIRVR